MAVKQTGRFTSEAQYLKTLAKSSDLFNQSTYADLVAQGRGAEYSAAIYGTKDKTSTTFDWGDYNLLSGEDQYAYVVNEYYVDRSEYKTDEKTGERYNVYERNKGYLDYKIEEQIKENIYNSLSVPEKIIYSIGGFLGDAVSTLYSIGEGFIDVVLFLAEGFGRIGEALGSETFGEAADLIREWAAADTTGARAFQAEMEDFTKKYTVWDKNAFASTTREVYTSIVKMAPLALNVVAPGVGSTIYYTSMGGDVYNQTIQANPDIDYGKLFAYTAGSVGLEALVEWGSAKIFGGDTISKAIGFKGKGGLEGYITSKLAGKPAALFFAKTGLNMFTEGLEEGVTEIFGTLLEQATVNPDSKLTLGNIFHAALVGAITGGVMTGGAILGTKSLVIDPKTGDFMVDDKGNYVTWNKLTKEQRKTIGKQAKVGKLNTIAYKESLSNYVDSLNNISEVTKLKNKYNEDVKQLQQNHADEYNKAVEQDVKTYEQQGLNALKLAKLIETIGVSDFKKAVETLQNSNDKAIELIDKYLNPRIAETAKLREVQSRFEKNNPGLNISFKETLTNEEKRIQNAVKKAYGVDVYFVDYGSSNGLNPSTFIRGENEIYINADNVKNMSYQHLFDSVIKQELVDMTLKGDIISQTDFRKLIQTIIPESSEITEITDDLKTTLTQKLLFEDLTVDKVFDTNKSLFSRMAKWINSLKKKNRMAKKTDANKVEFNQLLKIRQRYVDAVAKAIGNELDVLQAKIVMELSDEEVQSIKDKYQTDATNEHVILMKTDFTNDASEKRKVERFLINNRIGDKRRKLDYSQIYDPDYYNDDFVKTVIDSNPGLLFQDALWYYISDNFGYSISQTEGMIYKQVNLVKESNTEFTKALQNAIENKNKSELEKYNTIDKILKPEFLKSFDKTDVGKVTIEYVDVLPANGRTIVNNDGTIKIQINTDAYHMKDGLDYTIYHEVSHALGYVQGFPFGVSKKAMIRTLQSQKPTLIKTLGLMMFDSDFVEDVTYAELVSELASEIYYRSQGERYASGERESFVQDADGFDVIGSKVIGKGRFAKIAGVPLEFDFTGYTYAVAESETNIKDFIGDLSGTNYSEEIKTAIANNKLSRGEFLRLLNSDKISSDDAETNKLISYFFPDNVHTKSIQDLRSIVPKGLALAATFYRTQQENTDLDRETIRTIDELTTYATSDADVKNKYVKFLNKIINKLEEPENSTIYAKLLKMDFKYNFNDFNKIYKALMSEYGLDSRKKEQKLKVETTDIGDVTQAETFETQELTQITEDDVEDTGILAIADTTDLYGELTTSTEGKAFEFFKSQILDLRDSPEFFNYINKLKTELTTNDFYKTNLNPSEYNALMRIIEKYSKTSMQNNQITPLIKQIKKFIKENNIDLTQDEQALFGVDKSEFSYNQTVNYIKSLQKLYDSLPGRIKTTTTTTTTTTEKLPVTQKTKEIEAPKEIKQITTEVVELSDALSSDIVEALEKIREDKGGKESEVQLVDKTANKEHVRLSKDIIAERSDIFFKINKDNFETIRNDLIKMNTDTSRRAVILLDLYGFLYLADTAEYRNKMHDLWAQETSIGMTRGGIQSALVRENTAQALKQEIESKGREIEVTNDDVVEILGDEAYSDPKYEIIKSDLRIQTIKQKLEGVSNEDIEVEIISPDDYGIDKDAEITRLKEANKQLNQDVLDLTIENETDRKILLDMLQEEIELKTAMEEGDYVAVLDILLNKMGLEEASEAFRKMMKVFWTKSKQKDVIIGKYTIDAEGNVKPFSKLRRFVGDLLTKFKKFRMWALLSSPVTYVKNWVGNIGMKGLDNTTRSIEKFINQKTKLGELYSETDLKYVSDKKDKVLAQKIKKVYGNYISSLIRGTEARYDVTGQKYQDIQRLQNEENIKNGNILQKSIGLALKYEDWGLNTGFLGDEAMLSNSICEKVSDLIASNTDYLLKGIENEYNVLKNQKKQLEKTLKDAQEQLKKTPSTEIKLSQRIQKTITNTIQKLDRISAMDSALRTKNTSDILSALSESEVVRLFKNAKDRAFTQYFKNNNKLNEFLSKMGEKSPIAAELISWVMPFPKVAANILMMAYRYSPLNIFSTLKEWSKVHQQQEIIKIQEEILKNGSVYGENIGEQIKSYRTEYESLSKIKNPSEDIKTRIKHISEVLNAYEITQKYKRDPEAVARLSRRIAETTVGTTLWIAGTIMAVLGLIDIDDDDYMGVSLKFGDLKISLSELAPTMTTFSVGAAMVWAWKNNQSATLKALDVLYDNTLLGNLENMFHYSSAESFISNLTINYMSQYIPSVLKLITKMSDPTQKDKTGNYFTKLIRTFGSYLPGLSYLVPTKINPYTGEPVMRSGTDSIPFNIFYAIFPLNVRYAPKTELEKLAETLETETTGLSGTFTINGIDHKITDKSYLANFRAKNIQNEYAEISSNKKRITVENEDGKRVEKYWKDLTEKEKKRVLSSLYTKATTVSKVEYWTSLGNKYIVTNQDDLKYYKSIIRNKSNIIYKQSWSKSKFVER